MRSPNSAGLNCKYTPFGKPCPSTLKALAYEFVGSQANVSVGHQKQKEDDRLVCNTSSRDLSLRNSRDDLRIRRCGHLHWNESVKKTSLKFLDILDEALRRRLNVKSLRYGGTVRPSLRKNIEDTFADPSVDVPLLITAGAGGVDLNITTASLTIQTEVWPT